MYPRGYPKKTQGVALGENLVNQEISNHTITQSDIATINQIEIEQEESNKEHTESEDHRSRRRKDEQIVRKRRSKSSS